MVVRRALVEIGCFAILAAGAGCDGEDAKSVANDGAAADPSPVEIPEAGSSSEDAELIAPDSPPAARDVLAEPDAPSPDTVPRTPDAGFDTQLPDGHGSDAVVEAGALAPKDPRELGRANDVTTVVVLPDTQYYSSLHPDVFASQSRWLVEQSRGRRMAAVLHVGDLVDVYNDENQWKVASSAMHALDGLIPYVVTTGNHDTDADRLCPMVDYFSPATMPWIAGTLEARRVDNSYALVDIGAKHWLVLALEYGPRDVVMTWADSVLKTYPDLPAIIVTHAYLYSDGQRYDLAVSGLDNSRSNFQWFIPQAYGYTSSQGINDGEAIWQKLVLGNSNVRLVVSGHANGAARLTSRRPDGSVVHQVLSDYQGLYSGTADDLGGSGYLRLLEFDFHHKTIRVRTYSPYLNSYLTDDGNQFTLSVEM